MTARLLYTTFMLLALLVFVVARHFQPTPKGLAAEPWWKRTALGLAAFVGGALGAKFPFVLDSGASWFDHTAWLNDGKTITTGLIGAYVAVELTKLTLDIKAKTGDTFAVPLALALA